MKNVFNTTFLTILLLSALLVSCGPDAGDYPFDNPYDETYNLQPDTGFVSISSVSNTYRDDGIHRNPLTFSWDGVDNDGTVTEYLYRLDGGEWQLSGQLFAVYSTIDTGIHTFYVKAGDDKGAFDLTPEEVTFEVDATPPSVSFTTPRHNASDVDAVNASITATFNEGIDEASINTSTLTLLDEAGDPVGGILDYTYNTLTFTPSSSLGNGASYNAIISSTVSDRVGNLMLSGYTWSFSVLPWDDTPPQVSSTTPSRNEVKVTVDSSITAIFSEEMTAFTISTSTFKLEGPSGFIDGVVSHSGVTASFNPTEFLAYSTTYVASITTGAKDLAGNSLSTNYQWAFTTGPVPDTTPPTVSFVDPINNDSDVSANSAISVSFSEPVDAMSVTTDSFKLFNNISGLPVAGAVTIAGTTATFIPLTSLNYATLFTASLSKGIKDLAGNQLPSLYEWNFTTGEAPDLTPPAVTLTTPGRDTKGTALNSSVSATFSEALDPSSVSTVTFELKNDFSGFFEDGSVIYNGTTAVFTPFSSLESSTWYVAIVRADIKDVAGNSMPIDYSWRFQTSDGPDEVAPIVSKTAPFENATAVAINSSIVATFNEPVEPSTISTATFTLWDEYSNPVKGTVSYSGLSATFVPYSTLQPWYEYTAVVSFLVTDTAGNPMNDHYFWTFSTGDVSDITSPVATVLLPMDGYTSVTKDVSIILSFSEPMNGTTINVESLGLSGPGGTVSGNVYYDGGDTAIFTPISTLSVGTHIATFGGPAKDLAGNPLLSELVWSFDVVDSVDDTVPFVDSTSPLEGESSVDVNSFIYAEFSEPMDRTFINTSTFTLFDGTAYIDGSVYYDGVLTAMFIPAAPLTYSGYYTATLTTDIRDKAGNPLQSPGFAWQFGTGDVPLNITYGISGGSYHSLAIKNDKSLSAWGYNTNGELGDGTTDSSLLPVQTLGLTGVIASAAGDNHSMALLTDKTVWVWGDNTLGQLGIGVFDNYTHPTAVPLPGISNVVSLSAGSYHSMALLSDGTVWTWGDNTCGQLGDGTDVDRASPVQVVDPGDVSGYLQGVESIAAGEQHSAAVKSDGSVWTWGKNDAGQLGNMTTADSFVPVSVIGLSSVKEVAAGSYHTLALKYDGTVWAWGFNNYGQLGNSTNYDTLDLVLTPIQVTGLAGVNKISSGSFHGMALLSDGTVWSWGYNLYGQLGNESIVNTYVPVQASGLTGVKAISGGSMFSISLKLDGTVWTWGDNSAGQLGDGTDVDSSIPVKVAW